MIFKETFGLQNDNFIQISFKCYKELQFKETVELKKCYFEYSSSFLSS
jgi:hypothetical protein